MLRERNIQIASYGLDVKQSNRCPSEAIETARKFGVDVSGHVSRGIDVDKIREADSIILMEYTHYKDFVKLFPRKKDRSKLLREFAPFPTSVFCNINDPYGYEIEEYRKCFSLIERSLNSFVEKMVNPKER
jgi:protein-tyrosine phosphatase